MKYIQISYCISLDYGRARRRPISLLVISLHGDRHTAQHAAVKRGRARRHRPGMVSQ